MARVLKGSHSFTCTSSVRPLTEWTIPVAFSFPAEAGTHSPTPEGWKAELALGGLLALWKQLQVSTCRPTCRIPVLICASLTHRHTDWQTDIIWTVGLYYKLRQLNNRCAWVRHCMRAKWKPVNVCDYYYYWEWYSDNLRPGDLWRVLSYHTVRRRRKVKPSNVLVNKPVNGFTRNDLSHTTERCGIRGTMQSHSDEACICRKRSTTTRAACVQCVNCGREVSPTLRLHPLPWQLASSLVNAQPFRHTALPQTTTP